MVLNGEIREGIHVALAYRLCNDIPMDGVPLSNSRGYAVWILVVKVDTELAMDV